jgi:hypothetical protein
MVVETVGDSYMVAHKRRLSVLDEILLDQVDLPSICKETVAKPDAFPELTSLPVNASVSEHPWLTTLK